MLEEKLLEAYKKYDSKSSQIKIFVSYIKPSFLFKSEILTPIHLGRSVANESSKDGQITEEDLNWLYKNCIGDDDFSGNISYINRRVGFLTGTYWAWKNYDKLGNPDYFGSFGYRRLLEPTFFNKLGSVDFIAPKPVKLPKNIKEQFMLSHGEKLCDAMIDIAQNTLHDDLELFEQYLEQSYAYLFEIYIMKKELFFDFCNWIFNILFYFLDKYKDGIKSKQIIQANPALKNFLGEKIQEVIPKPNENEVRDIAFILERLTGFYLFKLTKEENLNYIEIPTIELNASNNTIKPHLRQIIISKMKENVKSSC